MLDPESLYSVTGEAHRSPEGEGPVLLHALDGFLDAGSAGRLASEHLIGTLEGQVVATFDIDLLHDYRARRPPLVFAEDHYEDYTAPELAIHELRDAAGRPFLLLSGPEPDVAWEAFVVALKRLIDRFGVSLTIGLGGVPMTVPHTRPITLTMHATRSDLVTRSNVWRGRIRVPASAAALVELRLGEAGHDAMGFVAHVPHYLAAVENPEASAALLEAVIGATGLVLPVEELREAAVERRREIDEQIEGEEQVQQVVRALESQYDAMVEENQGGTFDAGAPMPTGEELGAELERFLTQLDHRDEPPSGPTP